MPVMKQTVAREKVQHLVEKFNREQAAGVISQYNESETKTGFIEPLLQALEWNTQDRNEVGLEEKISGGRVDYSLKIKGSLKIYIEAKPPRAKLTRPEAISQAITYGYNKRSVPWVLKAILDFAIIKGVRRINATVNDAGEKAFRELESNGGLPNNCRMEWSPRGNRNGVSILVE